MKELNLEKEEFISKVKLALKTLREYQNPITKSDHPDNKFIWTLLRDLGCDLFLMGLQYFIVSVTGCNKCIFLVRIFIIQHDCGHNSFVESTSWRKRIGYFCSLVSSVPYSYWAKSHHFHHMNNGMLEVRDIGDIDTLTVKEFASLSKFARFKYRLYRSGIVMFFFGPLYYIFIHNRLPLVNLEEFKNINQV